MYAPAGGRSAVRSLVICNSGSGWGTVTGEGGPKEEPYQSGLEYHEAKTGTTISFVLGLYGFKGENRLEPKWLLE